METLVRLNNSETWTLKGTAYHNGEGDTIDAQYFDQYAQSVNSRYAADAWHGHTHATGESKQS